MNDTMLPEAVDMVRMVGTCNHTGYPEYDSMTGYVERTYSVEWEDSSGTRWRKTCQVINLGRPDRGIPVDPDEAMTPEEFGVGKHLGPAIAKMKENKRERDQVILERARAYLAEHGPHSGQQLGKALGVGAQRVRYVLRGNRQVFQYLGGQQQLWGVVGKVYKREPQRRYTPKFYAIVEALRQHGPQTTREIGKRVYSEPTSILNLLKNYNDVFMVVSKKPAVWGLVGVHDGT